MAPSSLPRNGTRTGLPIQSRPAQIRDASVFEIRSPSDSTACSTLRVDTPATFASCTTETSAYSLRRELGELRAALERVSRMRVANICAIALSNQIADHF